MSDVMKLKGMFSVVASVFSYLYGCINELIIILVIFMLFDYITGIILAIKQKQFNPDKGIDGAVKKACYSIIIIMGFLMDYIIGYIGPNLNLHINTGGLIGAAVVVYLISTEGLSATRNLINLGLPVPKFLINVFENLKEKSEGGNEDDKDSK